MTSTTRVRPKEFAKRLGFSVPTLYRRMGAGRDFSSWIKNRIEVYGFAENVDYVTAQNLSSPKRGSLKCR